LTGSSHHKSRVT